MSKKLAEGIDGLVLDIKTGSGAFMKTIEKAIVLANSLSSTAEAFGKKVIAFITDMNQPLGHNIGNWLEVVEAVNILKGDVIDDLSEVTLNLAGAMIFLGGKAGSIEEGYGVAIEMIKTGKAFDKFIEMVIAQGGDASYIKNTNKYKKPKFNESIYSDFDGYIRKIDSYEIGMAALTLGAGRLTKEDLIIPTAGLIFLPKVGDKIEKGDKILNFIQRMKKN